MALNLTFQHLGRISPMKKVDSSPRTPEQHRKQHRTRMSLPVTSYRLHPILIGLMNRHPTKSSEEE